MWPSVAPSSAARGKVCANCYPLGCVPTVTTSLARVLRLNTEPRIRHAATCAHGGSPVLATCVPGVRLHTNSTPRARRHAWMERARASAGGSRRPRYERLYDGGRAPRRRPAVPVPPGATTDPARDRAPARGRNPYQHQLETIEESHSRLVQPATLAPVERDTAAASRVEWYCLRPHGSGQTFSNHNRETQCTVSADQIAAGHLQRDGSSSVRIRSRQLQPQSDLCQ